MGTRTNRANENTSRTRSNLRNLFFFLMRLFRAANAGRANMPRWSRLTLCIAVFALALSVTSSSARSEDERAAEVIQFPSESLPGKPLELVGHLRRPTGPGPFPAVILLHGC